MPLYLGRRDGGHGVRRRAGVVDGQRVGAGTAVDGDRPEDRLDGPANRAAIRVQQEVIEADTTVEGDGEAGRGALDGKRVVADIAVDRQPLGGADVERERPQIRPSELHAAATVRHGEVVADGASRPVHLDGVRPGIAGDAVAAVAVVPDEEVVVRPTVHRVGAPLHL